MPRSAEATWRISRKSVEMYLSAALNTERNRKKSAKQRHPSSEYRLVNFHFDLPATRKFYRGVAIFPSNTVFLVVVIIVQRHRRDSATVPVIMPS